MVIAQLNEGEAPPRVVLEIVRRMEAGQVILLPTDTVYGLHALARNAAAVDRIRRIKRLEDNRPFVNLYNSAVGLGEFVRLPEGSARRRILDSWPGSITWVLPAAEGVPEHIKGEDDTVGVRIPDNQLIRSICAAMNDLIVSTSANRHGNPAASTRYELDPGILEEVDGAVFQVEPLAGHPSEVIRWTPAGPEILRSRDGSSANAQVTKILIVCTGNTCRSPMAEAILRERLKESGGDQFVVRGAGTVASEGHPAEIGAIQAMSERGVELQGHRSRPLTTELMDWADVVLVMTTDHLAELHERFPDYTQKAFLFSAYPEMDLEGIYGIDDPYGFDSDTYRTVAEEIATEADRIVAHLLAGRSGSGDIKGE
ncbi:low molecular weight protein-tyrosine-phosphatase YwlE [bacterium BMS3Bbin04]|nr:low molecular weight protein-tyrosine-phosphatase YwlE [bacterium BMS3Bbin04]